MPNLPTSSVLLAAGNDPIQASMIGTVTEISDVGDLDLSMLPLDAKSWSERLKRKQMLNQNQKPQFHSNIGPNIMTNGTLKARHNCENYNIKNIRGVNETQYSGNKSIHIFQNTKNMFYLISILSGFLLSTYFS